VPGGALRMPKKTDRSLIVGLDIGTTKVAAVVGSLTNDGRVDIVGLGTSRAHGLKKGVVVNIDATVQAISRCIEEAELIAGCEIHSVYTCIAGEHINSFNSNGIVAIRGNAVTDDDVVRVVDAAKAVAIPAEQKILHILPQEFVIDNQDGISEPIGMSGVRLEAKVHIVTGAVSAAQNIVTCIRRCNLEVEDIILSPLAASYAVLREDEKQLGVCLIDIGGGTTDVAVFNRGALKFSNSIPVAGDQITNDIAVALRKPLVEAEDIKLRQANMSSESSSVPIEPSAAFAIKNLEEVVGPRVEELFLLIKEQLLQFAYDEKLRAGIVLTGGSANLQGIATVAERIFDTSVRIGKPNNTTGLVDVVNNTAFATGIGLLKYSHIAHIAQRESAKKHYKFINFMGKLKNWFNGYF